MGTVRFSSVGPTWVSVPSVFAFTTLRGEEENPISFSGDSAVATEHRSQLEAGIAPDTPIHWLTQVHGNTTILLPGEQANKADAAVTFTPRTVCAIRTADCVPVVFTNRAGDRVGVAHAGWRGIIGGVVESAFTRLGIDPTDTLVWLGPAIGPQSYEVGEDVREAFSDPKWDTAFTPGRERRKYHLNTYAAVRQILTSLGVPSTQISGGSYDTFTDDRFHSVRRYGPNSGHMATVVWFE